MLLLIVAIAVAGHLIGRHRAVRPIDHWPVLTADRFCRISGPGIEEGLYELPGSSCTVAALYRRLGLALPTPADVQLIHPERAALVVAPGRPPRIAGQAPELAPFFFEPVPVNEASRELLMAVAGIGPRLADRIIDRRRLTGGFHRPADLLAVKGIGPARLASLAEHLAFDGPDSPAGPGEQ